MKCFMIFCSLVLCVITSVMTVIISTPDMQRKFQRESCKFQWNVDGYFTTYTIQMLSAGETTAIGPNTNHTFDSRKNVVTLLIWNIQLANAGHYSLLVSSGPTNQANSAALLFVYDYPFVDLTLAVGRSPAYEGDTIELNCSANSNSLPVAFQPKMYYSWSNDWYGNFRNISSGPAVRQNGDAVPGYSFKNDGKTLVITSVQQADSYYFLCFCQEERSFLIGESWFSMQVYSKPFIPFVDPPSKIFNAALSSDVNCYLPFEAIPPLTSYSNWSFTDGSGNTTELPLTFSNYNQDDSTTSGSVNLIFVLASLSSYGNYSVTFNNSNGSITETFQVRPPGPPDKPSNFIVQYVTHSLISIQWRCMWSNGDDQSVFVRLTDVRSDTEVETQIITPDAGCYNLDYSTLFESSIQPETDYEASIWSINSFGSSEVVNLAVRTKRRVIFETSSANISISGTQATIGFSIAYSTNSVMWLNVACCVELTALCSRNQSYAITNRDSQVVYDTLPAGTEYVFDLSVFESDGYTYTCNLAIVDGLRVSMVPVSTDSSTAEKANPLLAAVIVLAILFGLAVLGLIGCLIAFLVYNGRQKQQPIYDNQLPPTQPPTRPSNIHGRGTDYELPTVSSAGNADYTQLEVLRQRPDENYN